MCLYNDVIKQLLESCVELKWDGFTTSGMMSSDNEMLIFTFAFNYAITWWHPSSCMCIGSPRDTSKLHISWSYSSGSTHRGEVDLKWLRENSYSPTSLRERQQRTIPLITVSLKMCTQASYFLVSLQQLAWVQLQIAMKVCVLYTV